MLAIRVKQRTAGGSPATFAACSTVIEAARAEVGYEADGGRCVANARLRLGVPAYICE